MCSWIARIRSVLFESILLGSMLAVGSAQALPVSLEVRWGPDQETLENPSGTELLNAATLNEIDNGDGTFAYSGDHGGTESPGAWSLGWDVLVDPDPFVNGIFAVTNTATTTQNFVLTFTLPIFPPISPSSLTTGSVAATLTADGDGGVLGHVGTDAMYLASVDGLPFRSLLDFDNSVAAGPFTSVTASGFSFGATLAGPNEPGPAIANEIAIRLAFSLTPGDSASFTSRFEVIPIPEPLSLGLVLWGITGLAFAGRPRREHRRAAREVPPEENRASASTTGSDPCRETSVETGEDGDFASFTEFLAADESPLPIDPAFADELREKLWELVQRGAARRRREEDIASWEDARRRSVLLSSGLLAGRGMTPDRAGRRTLGRSQGAKAQTRQSAPVAAARRPRQPGA